MNAEPSNFPNLSCLIERDKATGTYIGHCLNYDLMDSGKTPQEAWENLKFVMKSHIEFCYTHLQSGLKRTAKRRDWDRFFEAIQSDPSSVIAEKLELDLKPPTLPEQEMGIWIQKVLSDRYSPDLCPSQNPIPVH
jgi:predicted RNase H-like HicB family nuclease